MTIIERITKKMENSFTLDYFEKLLFDYQLEQVVEVKQTNVVINEYFTVNVYANYHRKRLIYSDSLVKGEDLDKFIKTLYKSPTIALIFDVFSAYWRKTQDYFVKYTGDDFILIVQPDDSLQFNVAAEYDENKNFILNLEMIREFYANTIEDTKLKTEHFEVDASIYPAKELRHRTMFNLKLKTSVNTQSPDANNAMAVVNGFIDETTDVNVKAF